MTFDRPIAFLLYLILYMRGGSEHSERFDVSDFWGLVFFLRFCVDKTELRGEGMSNGGMTFRMAKRI